MVCKPTKVTHSPYSIQHTGHITYVAWYVDLTLSGTILKNVFLSHLKCNKMIEFKIKHLNWSR